MQLRYEHWAHNSQADNRTRHQGDCECLKLIVVTVIFIQNNMVKFDPPVNIGTKAHPRSNGWYLIR